LFVDYKTMSFYRIYRPQVFAEIDNASIRKHLHSLLGRDRKDLPHAYLFSGPRGTGKTTAARLVAKLFVCEKLSPVAGPCGSCRQCLTVAEGRHIDILEIDAASNRGIDEIRTLRDGIALAPLGGTYKIYIIDEVHMLTTEAFNALLKTLEEPPIHAVFVLATTDPNKLPKTITSRCVALSFKEASHKELIGALVRVKKAEKIEIEDDALDAIAMSSEGSFRDAVKMLEQASLHQGKISGDIINELLYHASSATVADFITSLARYDVKSALIIIDKIMISSGDIKVFLTQTLQILEQKLVSYASGNLTDSVSAADIKDLIHRFTRVYGEMKVVAITQLPLELAVVEFCEERVSRVRSGQPDPVKSTASGIHNEPVAKNVKLNIPAEKEDNNIVGMLSLDRLKEYWKDVIEECKPHNHSLAGILRSARPKGVSHGIVTVEAFYKFHQEKLSEARTKEMLSSVIKKLFGELVKVEIILGRK